MEEKEKKSAPMWPGIITYFAQLRYWHSLTYTVLKLLELPQPG